jgi:hypothetical protein
MQCIRTLLLAERSDHTQGARISYRTRARTVDSHRGCAAVKAALLNSVNSSEVMKHMISYEYLST